MRQSSKNRGQRFDVFYVTPASHCRALLLSRPHLHINMSILYSDTCWPTNDKSKMLESVLLEG